MVEKECVNGWICLDTENNTEIVLGHETACGFIVTKIRVRKFDGTLEELEDGFTRRLCFENGLHKKLCVPLEQNHSLWYCAVYTFKNRKETICFHYTMIDNFYLVLESVIENIHDVMVIHRDLEMLTNWLSANGYLKPMEYLIYNTRMVEIIPKSDFRICRRSDKKSIIFTNENIYSVITLDSTDTEVYFKQIETLINTNSWYNLSMIMINDENCYLSILVFNCQYNSNQELNDLITFRVRRCFHDSPYDNTICG